jgi:hypothetical protein
MPENSREIRVLFPEYAETLLVTPLECGKYLLEESSGLGEARWHDVLELKSLWDGSFEFVRISERSGYAVHEFIFKEPVATSAELSGLLARWGSMGCACERIFVGIVILHVPPGLEIDVRSELHEVNSAVKRSKRA